MKHLLTVLFVASTLWLVSGCKTTESACSCVDCKCPTPCACGQPKPKLGMMNDSCPMSGKKLAADCPRSDWKGNTIGFCGNGCKSKFDSMDAEGKDNYVAEMNSGGS